MAKNDNRNIEKLSVSHISDFFIHKDTKNLLTVNISDNDKTENYDGQIVYKNMTFNIQVKGSKNNNHRVKNKYFKSANINYLIYFFIGNINTTYEYNDKSTRVFKYKIFSPKDATEYLIRTNTQSISITNLNFKEMVFEDFINELEIIFQNEVPEKIIDIEDINHIMEGSQINLSFPSNNLSSCKPIKADRCIAEKNDAFFKPKISVSGAITSSLNYYIHPNTKSFHHKYKDKKIKLISTTSFDCKNTMICIEKARELNLKVSNINKINDLCINLTLDIKFDICNLEHIYYYEAFLSFLEMLFSSIEFGNKDNTYINNFLKYKRKDIEQFKKFKNWIIDNNFYDFLDDDIKKNCRDIFLNYINLITNISDGIINFEFTKNCKVLLINNKISNLVLEDISIFKITYDKENPTDDYITYLYMLYNNSNLSFDNFIYFKNINYKEKIFSSLNQKIYDKNLIDWTILFIIHYYIQTKDIEIYNYIYEYLKIKDNNISFINMMQLKQHKNEKLTKRETIKLIEIDEEFENTSNIMGQLCTSILLNDKESAILNYTKLNDDEKKAFNKFPIYSLFKKFE